MCYQSQGQVHGPRCAQTTAARWDTKADAAWYPTEMQLHGQIIDEILCSLRPGSGLLIFGAGNDTEFWTRANAGGQTVVLEDDPLWVERSGHYATCVHVSYTTRQADALQLLDDEPTLRKVYDLLPTWIRKSAWDVILVDGPGGSPQDKSDPAFPGRMQAIYTAALLRHSETEIFVDDFRAGIGVGNGKTALVVELYTRHFLLGGACGTWNLQLIRYLRRGCFPNIAAQISPARIGNRLQVLKTGAVAVAEDIGDQLRIAPKISTDALGHADSEPIQSFVCSDSVADMREQDGSGDFFLVGSWDDWTSFMKLSPTIGGASCRARVHVRPGLEEFQIVKDCDWTQRFYPDPYGLGIIGPGNQHGANWQVTIPPGHVGFEVLWYPHGARSIYWKPIEDPGEEAGAPKFELSVKHALNDSQMQDADKVAAAERAAAEKAAAEKAAAEKAAILKAAVEFHGSCQLGQEHQNFSAKSFTLDCII